MLNLNKLSNQYQRCALTLLSGISIGLGSPISITNGQEPTNTDIANTSSPSSVIDGTWQLEKHIRMGEVAPLIDSELQFSHSQALLITNGQVNSRYAVQLDLTKTPHHIDLIEVVENGNGNRGTVIRGIFEIRGDTLVLIFTSAKDVPRPDQLVNKKNNPYSIDRFKRVIRPQPLFDPNSMKRSPEVSIVARTPQSIARPAIKIESDFDEAYKLYRKHKYKAANEILTRILAKNDNFDALAVESRIRFHETLTDRMAVATKHADADISIIYSDTVNAVRPIYLKMITIGEKNPGSAIAQELLGEVASEFAVSMESFTEMLTSPFQIQEAAIESQHLRTAASNAYRRSVSIDPSRAIPNLRIAASLIKEKGDRSDSRIAEYLLQGIQNSPADPACVDLLIIVMWDSSMLEDEQMKSRAMLALRNVTGDALDELRVAQLKTQKLLDLGYATLERFATSEHQEAQVNESLSRLRRALDVVDAALLH